MQVPLHIECLNFSPEPFVRMEIERHVGALEKHFGRITACRVSIKGPGGRHQTGGLYKVTIWLSLPDHSELTIAQSSDRDERYAHLVFALNDAFKRAKRRMRDHIHRMRGDIKMHVVCPQGVITHLSADGNFGFLTSDDGREIYFHRNSVLHGSYRRLHRGDRVSFREEQGTKGAQASTVHRL